jgi:hypothetical protein
MTPTAVDPDVQKSNMVQENSSTIQQGSVYSQPKLTTSAPIAPVTSATLNTPRVAPQLVNGQVIMPKHEVSYSIRKDLALVIVYILNYLF